MIGRENYIWSNTRKLRVTGFMRPAESLDHFRFRTGLNFKRLIFVAQTVQAELEGSESDQRCTGCSIQNATLTVLASFVDVNTTIKRVSYYLLVRKDLQNSFMADAENVHHLLEDRSTLLSVYFVRLCKVFLGQFWRQSVQYCVSVPPSFVGYSNKLFL
jgi:hypothetical protein